MYVPETRVLHPADHRIVRVNNNRHLVDQTFVKQGNNLHPITHTFVRRDDWLHNFHGEILECFNCFLPDHPFTTAWSSGTLTFQGGIRYGSELRHSHNFDMDISMAFTPLPPGVRFSRSCWITHDFSGAPALEDLHWFSRHDVPGGNVHPSDWSAFISLGPRAQWEANALAAMSRGGSHGFHIGATQPQFTPPVGLENSYHPDFMFLDYLTLFQWVQLGNSPSWITNTSTGQILRHSAHHSISQAGFIDTRVRRGAFAWDPNWQLGPDYWPFEFSAFEHRLEGIPSRRNLVQPSGFHPFVFWIYDYNNSLGTTLQNLESRVESGEGVTGVFPRGYIPHEDFTGPQNNFWGYRWISNKWKYAPWERYPNLM